KMNRTALAKQLGVFSKAKEFDVRTLKIDDRRLIIYRYVASKRVLLEKSTTKGEAFNETAPSLPLRPVPKQIEEGRHYVSAEIHFSLAPRGLPVLHWIAIVEAETLCVLYLRAFIDNVNGMVFQVDPVTTNAGPLPSANNAALNLIRSSVLLQGLIASAGGAQRLRGN